MHTPTLDLALRKLRVNTFRTYFDSGSFEFSQSDFNEKFTTLAKIFAFEMDFKSIFYEYKLSYEREGYMHIHRNAIRTIVEFISYLENGNTYQTEVVFKAREMSDDEILDWFISIFKKKIVPQFTIQRLVLAYLDYRFNRNCEKYQKLSRFFQIDFEADNAQTLYERAIKENLDPIMYGYYGLNVYLKNVLFGNLYDNRISDLDPHLEMPMTKGIIYFIHKHYPKEIHEQLEKNPEFRASKIMGFILDLVDVLYRGEKVNYYS